MGITTRVKLLDDSVNSAKIAADTLVAADIDETASYNFTNTANTFVAQLIKTTRFMSAGTNTGFFLGTFELPANSTSTVVVNSVCTPQSFIFLVHEDSIGTTTGTSVSHYVSAKTSGSFTVSASTALPSAITIGYMIVNY